MQSTQAIAVIASNISKKYGRQRVLKDINLKIKIGEFYVLMGPNGSGKTTLTSILASVKLPTTGKIKLFGNNPEIAKKFIGYVPLII